MGKIIFEQIPYLGVCEKSISFHCKLFCDRDPDLATMLNRAQLLSFSYINKKIPRFLKVKISPFLLLFDLLVFFIILTYLGH